MRNEAVSTAPPTVGNRRLATPSMPAVGLSPPPGVACV
jgi:hypothetical protein